MRTSPTITVNHSANALARFWRCDAGVNAIEFAFVVPFIVAILLMTTQIAVVFVAQSYLETVAENAMRLVLTNQANSMTKANFATAVCATVNAMFNCSNLIIDVEQAPTSAANMASAMPQFDVNGNLKNPTNFTLAPAPAKMMLVVMYQWPVVAGPLGLNFSNVGNGTFLLVATEVFQIEPTS